MADSDSVHQQHQDGLIITAVVMTVIAGEFVPPPEIHLWTRGLTRIATFVAMRSTSRFIVIRNSGPDDYFMLAAMVCFPLRSV
jgi:hypothetical protein